MQIQSFNTHMPLKIAHKINFGQFYQGDLSKADYESLMRSNSFRNAVDTIEREGAHMEYRDGEFRVLDRKTYRTCYTIPLTKTLNCSRDADLRTKIHCTVIDHYNGDDL